MRNQRPPPRGCSLLIIAVVMWISPFGAVIAIVMISIFLTAHPTVAFVIGGTIALVIIIAVRERWHHRPF